MTILRSIAGFIKKHLLSKVDVCFSEWKTFFFPDSIRRKRRTRKRGFKEKGGAKVIEVLQYDTVDEKEQKGAIRFIG